MPAQEIPFWVVVKTSQNTEIAMPFTKVLDVVTPWDGWTERINFTGYKEASSGGIDGFRADIGQKVDFDGYGNHTLTVSSSQDPSRVSELHSNQVLFDGPRRGYPYARDGAAAKIVRVDYIQANHVETFSAPRGRLYKFNGKSYDTISILGQSQEVLIREDTQTALAPYIDQFPTEIVDTGFGPEPYRRVHISAILGGGVRITDFSGKTVVIPPEELLKHEVDNVKTKLLIPEHDWSSDEIEYLAGFLTISRNAISLRR